MPKLSIEEMKEIAHNRGENVYQKFMLIVKLNLNGNVLITTYGTPAHL